MAMRSIFELLEDEANALAKLSDREGAAWAVWHRIGERLKLNFNPSSGRVPNVERVGHRSIRVTYSSRICQHKPAASNF